MTHHHIPKDQNFQAPENQNITMKAQKYKKKISDSKLHYLVDIWYTYVTGDNN
jgi:hypothetical protein